MKFFWFIIAGLIGGIFGGMGMGGGTFLIPLLNIFYKVKQHTSQAINLIGFIPMAIVSLIIHIKNKMVKFDYIFYIIVPGIITCIIGCIIAKNISSDLLKQCFGAFLILLSFFQLYECIKKFKQK